MANVNQDRSAPVSETYTHGYHASVVAQHAARTATEAAAFLLPLLKSGMKLLDIGCGPGSITVGLAEIVAPGETVGVDLGETLIKQAREDAVNKGLKNLRFEVASAYSLPFADASFDAAYLHQVLQHLSRPVDALTEARRVLRPHGFIGVREVDWGSTIFWPRLPLLDRFLQIYHDVATRNGGDADAGRRVRSWLQGAGFRDATMSASTWVFPGRETTAAYGESWAQRTTQSNIAAKATEYGLATRKELEAIAAAWREWGRHPDAFFCFAHVEGIGVRV
jgi:ubiquinone/menaquinone biosynthesis C-methylase UbiE